MSHRNNEIDCKNMVTSLRINFLLEVGRGGTGL